MEALLGQLLLSEQTDTVHALQVLVEASSSSTILQKLNSGLRFLYRHSACGMMRCYMSRCLIYFQRGTSSEG